MEPAGKHDNVHKGKINDSIFDAQQHQFSLLLRQVRLHTYLILPRFDLSLVSFLSFLSVLSLLPFCSVLFSGLFSGTHCDDTTALLYTPHGNKTVWLARPDTKGLREYKEYVDTNDKKDPDSQGKWMAGFSPFQVSEFTILQKAYSHNIPAMNC